MEDGVASVTSHEKPENFLAAHITVLKQRNRDHANSPEVPWRCQRGLKK
jgi:hypothetical protein